MNWRPIAEAPKDGSVILLWMEDPDPEGQRRQALEKCHVVVGYYVGRPHDTNGYWYSDIMEVIPGYYESDWYREEVRLQPSFWMPIPSMEDGK